MARCHEVGEIFLCRLESGRLFRCWKIALPQAHKCFISTHCNSLQFQRFQESPFLLQESQFLAPCLCGGYKCCQFSPWTFWGALDWFNRRPTTINDLKDKMAILSRCGVLVLQKKTSGKKQIPFLQTETKEASPMQSWATLVLDKNTWRHFQTRN